MHSALLASLVLLCSVSAFSAQTVSALTSDPLSSCQDNFEVFDNTQVQTLKSDGICFVSVHPLRVDNMVYRDFLFDSEGLWMIFDSYGDGSESLTTAARNYHFFPRKTALSYKYIPEQKRLEVTSPSGKVVAFNTMKAIFTDLSGANTTINYEVKPENHGGIEIVQNEGLFMDGGYKRGQSPSQNPKDKVVFRDAANNACQLVNAEVYRYTADQDAVFKFKDEALKTFLKGRCPALRF